MIVRQVVLEPLPKEVRTHIDAYNSTVIALLRQFTAAASGDGRLVVREKGRDEEGETSPC